MQDFDGHGTRTVVSPAMADEVLRHPAAIDRIFAGGGEMRALCRAYDWSTTPLGPVSEWSASLRAAVGIVLGSSTPMFLWWGPELIQIYNDAYRPSFGAVGRHPKALGMRGRDCWTDIWDTIGPQIEQVMTTGVSTWHEDQYLPIERNGTLEDVWWTYSYSPVYEDDGSVAATLVTCLETTQRVLTERERARLLDETATAVRALGESEAQLRAIYDGTYESIGLLSAEGTLLHANRASLQFVQSRVADIIGRPFWETPWFGRTPGAAEAMRAAVARAAGGEFVRYQAALAPPAGEERIFDISLHPVRNEQGDVAFIVPEGRDVTDTHLAVHEREQLLAALEVERARLEQVFQRAPSFIVVLRGPEMVYEFVNEAYYGLIGEREVLAKPLLQALPELDGQPFVDILYRVRESGEPWIGREAPVLLQRTRGEPPETRYIDTVFQALVEADGTRSGVVAHGSDVTAHVLARREIERLLAESESARAEAEAARADAEAANRAKGDFLAIMSHELRTPLNAIGGYAELMQMGIRGPLTPEQAEDLRRIQTSQRHLLGLINEVLNYAKLETGSVHYDLDDVPVREALAAAESLVAPQARAKGLALSSDDCERTLAVRADPEKLRQILVNLLSNAVKFTAPGGRIEMTSGSGEHRVAIRIRDTGIGIAPDKLEAIFDPFVQVRSDLTRPHEGSGLGLAISRDLARGMGGDLFVESAPGAGSVFTLLLPAA